MNGRTKIAVTVSAILLIAVLAFVAVHARGNDGNEYRDVPINEGLLGTASFEVTDSEYSGTSTKGKIFAIDRGDTILVRVVGEVNMYGKDSFGIEIAVTPEGEDLSYMRHPKLTPIEVYCDLEDMYTPVIQPLDYGVWIGKTRATGLHRIDGSGTYVLDFETTQYFNREDGRIDMTVLAGEGPGLAYPSWTDVTIFFDN